MTRHFTLSDDESDGSKLAGSLVAGISITPAMAIFAVLPAWFVMLALGAAHDQWPVIPALGYWTTYLLLLGFSILNPFRKA